MAFCESLGKASQISLFLTSPVLPLPAVHELTLSLSLSLSLSHLPITYLFIVVVPVYSGFWARGQALECLPSGPKPPLCMILFMYVITFIDLYMLNCVFIPTVKSN
jgi:hypothetical protein